MRVKALVEAVILPSKSGGLHGGKGSQNRDEAKIGKMHASNKCHFWHRDTWRPRVCMISEMWIVARQSYGNRCGPLAYVSLADAIKPTFKQKTRKGNATLPHHHLR